MPKSRGLVQPPSIKIFFLEMPGEWIQGLKLSVLWLALAATLLGLMILGYEIFDRYGLVIGFFSGVAIDASVLFYADGLLPLVFSRHLPRNRNSKGVRDLEGRDPWGLLQTLRALSRKQNRPIPTLTEVDCQTPFICSAGLFSRRLRIFVSARLPERFSANEIEILLTGELLKARMGLTRASTTAAGFLNLWLQFLALLDTGLGIRMLIRAWLSGPPLRRAVPGPLTRLFLPISAAFLRLTLRPQRWLEFDQQLMAELGDSSELRRAYAEILIKLESYSRTLPMDLNLAEASIFPIYPLAHHTWSRWAAAQAPLPKRIEALVGVYPL